MFSFKNLDFKKKWMIRQFKILCKDVRKSVVLLCLRSILILLQNPSTWLLSKALFITIGVIFLVLLLPSIILSSFCLRWKLLSKKFLVVITRLTFITLWIFWMSGLTINTPLEFVSVMKWSSSTTQNNLLW